MYHRGKHAPILSLECVAGAKSGESLCRIQLNVGQKGLTNHCILFLVRFYTVSQLSGIGVVLLLYKHMHLHRLWCIHRMCARVSGRPAERSEALNPVHLFEPGLQEQHLSPSAFHALITRMFGLISPPV